LSQALFFYYKRRRFAVRFYAASVNGGLSSPLAFLSLVITERLSPLIRSFALWTGAAEIMLWSLIALVALAVLASIIGAALDCIGAAASVVFSAVAALAVAASTGYLSVRALYLIGAVLG
jgi:hypothetical protein